MADKDNISYREIAGKGLCWAMKRKDNTYELFGSWDTLIGYVNKYNGYHKFTEVCKESKERDQRFISYVLNTLNNCLYIPKDYYVYIVFVDKNIRYIGKGKGTRFCHAVSGTSHVYDLNRDYFENAAIEIFCYAEGLTEINALNLESGLISVYSRNGLYNTKGVKETYVMSACNLEEDELYSKLQDDHKLLACKVGRTDEYEDCIEFYENYKFLPHKPRLHA